MILNTQVRYLDSLRLSVSIWQCVIFFYVVAQSLSRTCCSSKSLRIETGPFPTQPKSTSTSSTGRRNAVSLSTSSTLLWQVYISVSHLSSVITGGGRVPGMFEKREGHWKVNSSHQGTGKVRAGDVRKYRSHLDQRKPHAEIVHPTHLTCILLLMCAKSPISWWIKLRECRK